MRASEHEEQAAFVEWAHYHEVVYPDLTNLFSIPNGADKSMASAMKFKKEGLKPGVPDLFLAVPRAPYHGLFIEMKAKGGKLSKEQRQWFAKLSRLGYAAVMCCGCEAAIVMTVKYLKGEYER